MSLSSSQLDAFKEVAQTKSFSKAAQNLHLTQSALSQRVKNLEEETQTTLFVREATGIRLTETGTKLLQYCRSKQILEETFLAELIPAKNKSLLGRIRIAGFSTITRSLILPAFQKLLLDHPQVQIEVMTEGMRRLPSLLKNGEVDFIILDHSMDQQGMEQKLLGEERNVLVKGKTLKTRNNTYLDHDLEDPTTLKYFNEHGPKPEIFLRSFLDEIYGIIDGVKLGLGKAVVPYHLIAKDKEIQVIQKNSYLKIPLYLHYYKSPFYTPLFKTCLQVLEKEIPKKLNDTLEVV